MFSVLPINDEKIISSCNPQTDSATVLMFNEDDNQVGYIVIEQIKSTLHIIGLSLKDCADYSNLTPNQTVNLDILLRSAGSYALNRNIFYINCNKLQLFPVLAKYGFTQVDKYLTINLKQLFKVCKN